jgi:hypothetical protein
LQAPRMTLSQKRRPRTAPWLRSTGSSATPRARAARPATPAIAKLVPSPTRS